MSDSSFKHLVAFLITLICTVAFIGGYFAAGFGWWWAVFTVFIAYGIVYSIID